MAGPEFTYGGGYGYRPDRMMTTAGMGAVQLDPAQQVGAELADLLISELQAVADPKDRALVMQVVLDGYRRGMAAKVGADAQKLTKSGLHPEVALRKAIEAATANLLASIYAQAATVGINFGALGCDCADCGSGSICGICPIAELGWWGGDIYRGAKKGAKKVGGVVKKVAGAGLKLLKKAACSGVVQSAVGKAAGMVAGKMKDSKGKAAAMMAQKGAAAAGALCKKGGAEALPEPEPTVPPSEITIPGVGAIPKWALYGGVGLVGAIILALAFRRPAAPRANPVRRRRRRRAR